MIGEVRSPKTIGWSAHSFSESEVGLSHRLNYENDKLANLFSYLGQKESQEDHATVSVQKSRIRARSRIPT